MIKIPIDREVAKEGERLVEEGRKNGVWLRLPQVPLYFSINFLIYIIIYDIKYIFNVNVAFENVYKNFPLPFQVRLFI